MRAALAKRSPNFTPKGEESHASEDQLKGEHTQVERDRYSIDGDAEQPTKGEA
jgi:hypothetical protein